jgi:hypothetical protein
MKGMKILDQQYMVTLSGGGDGQKKRLEVKMASTELSAGQSQTLKHDPTISSSFSEKDAPPLQQTQQKKKQQQQQQQQQKHPLMKKINKTDSKKSISDELFERSNSHDTVTDCAILDHIEMGNYANGYKIAAADEKRDFMMSGCCDRR